MSSVPERPLRILFALRAVNFDRVFECFIRELLRRGHRVAVVYDREKRGLPADATKLFDTIAAEHPSFSYEAYRRPREWWLAGATALRYAVDYLRYLEHGLPVSANLRQLLRDHAPDVLLVSPLVGLGESQIDYVRAAAAEGIPT